MGDALVRLPSGASRFPLSESAETRAAGQSTQIDPDENFDHADT